MKTIEVISKGKAYQVVVDDEDYEKVASVTWCVAHRHSGQQYAKGRIKTDKGIRYIYMHHWIMGQVEKGMTIDHINGNGLDNRRGNLRAATYTENNRNKGIRSETQTGFKGVYQKRKYKMYYARIKHEKRSVYIGAFALASDAARAYDIAARKYHGEFARLNFNE